MTTTGIFFNHILQGHEATERNAIETAQGLDFSSIETNEESYPFLNYIDTVNGIEIYYNYGCDSYCFAEALAPIETN